MNKVQRVFGRRILRRLLKLSEKLSFRSHLHQNFICKAMILQQTKAPWEMLKQSPKLGKSAERCQGKEEVMLAYLRRVIIVKSR